MQFQLFLDIVRQSLYALVHKLAHLFSSTVGSWPLWSAFIDDASEGDIHLKINSVILIWSTVILSLAG